MITWKSFQNTDSDKIIMEIKIAGYVDRDTITYYEYLEVIPKYSLTTIG